MRRVKTTAEVVYCIQGLDWTEDEAKVLAQQFAGFAEERESNTATRIEAVRKPVTELDDSVAKAADRQRCCSYVPPAQGGIQILGTCAEAHENV